MRLGTQASGDAGRSQPGEAIRGPWGSYFRFITTAGVDPTNNLAEQAIRFVVIDRLITQGTRSERGDGVRTDLDGGGDVPSTRAISLRVWGGGRVRIVRGDEAESFSPQESQPEARESAGRVGRCKVMKTGKSAGRTLQ